jgi:hypothetical protein
MGGIEVAYQWRPGNGGVATRWPCAIPNAGPALDWDRMFARLRSPGRAAAGGDAVDPATLTPEAFGRLIVEEGGRGRQAAAAASPQRARALGHESVACYDLAKVEPAKMAIDALAVALAKGDTKAVVEEVRGPGEDGCVVDAYDLALRLAKCDRLDEPARAAAAAAAKAVDALVAASYGGDALQRFVPGATGVYLVFPPGDQMVPRRDKVERLWSLCSWYSPASGAGSRSAATAPRPATTWSRTGSSCSTAGTTRASRAPAPTAIRTEAAGRPVAVVTAA